MWGFCQKHDRRWLNNIETNLISTGNSYQDINYGFDSVGNILSTENETLNHTTTQDYSYDGLYQITCAQVYYKYHNTGGTVTRTSQYTQEFSYDTIGNMLTERCSIAILAQQ